MACDPIILYGASGYTGTLIAYEAVKQGLRPVLAGRSPERVAPLAAQLGLEYRTFALDDESARDAGLAGMVVLLNCAGPFSHTAGPAVAGCLRAHTHYVDITGEIGVFEALARRGAKAEEAGIMLLPGAGFDVVPSDCLAAHLHSRLPTATRLTLAFRSLRAGSSHGTLMTMVEGIGLGGVVRQNGIIKRVPAAAKTRKVDFGWGPVDAVLFPWGDVSTAFYSTGIPNIEVYMALPVQMRRMLVLSRYLGGLLATGLVQRLLRRQIDAGRPGPTEAERARSQSLLWGEVGDDEGGRTASRLRTPDGYTLTALTAVAVVKRILAGSAPAGFQTPSRAYGADFILEFEGVTRWD